MSPRLVRLAPLTGLLFAVFAVIAFGSSQPPPGAQASGAKVIAFYSAHSSGQERSDYFWFLAFAFFLLFAGCLRDYLKSPLALAGAAVLVAGGTLYFGFDFALAVVPSHLDPGAAQALNVLALKLVFPMAAGGVAFGVATGLAIVRGAGLPTWLGWVTFVIALAMLTPGVLVGLVLLILWSAVASILIYRRSKPVPA